MLTFHPLCRPLWQKIAASKENGQGFHGVAEDGNKDISTPLLRPDVDERDKAIFNQILCQIKPQSQNQRQLLLHATNKLQTDLLHGS